LKKKLLSPIELKQFRLQQEEQRKFRAAELERKRLEEEKNNKKLVSPKELLDPKPVVEEIKEEPVIVEEPKDSIEVLRERLEEVASAIKEPKYYDEELAQLEVLIANKVELDEFNLEPINLKVQELQEYVSQLPKVKYYDEDLEKLTERVDQLQISGSEIFQQHGENLKEIKKVIHQMLEDLVKLDKREIPEAFDPTDIHNDIVSAKETFYERVAEIKKELSELPEVKYYDDELTQLQERIEAVRDSIPEIPEIKYYDDDLENLLGLIEEVRGNIPELPEVKYYENEISQLEEAIKNVEDRIPTVPEIRYYDDDIESLREQIKGVEGQIPEVPDIPEIKYYDDEIKILSEDIDKVRDSLINIKLAIRAVEKSVEDVEGREIPEAFDPTGLQIEIEKAFKEIEKLKEQPVTVKEDADPLLPLDQNFVTFDDLATHYRTFINRIQQQLTSLGGGGETRLEFLDDVDRNSAKTNGYVLQYDSSVGKFIGTSYVSGSGGDSYWSETNAGIYTTGNVAIGTDVVSTGSTALWVQGDARITGILSVGTGTITLDPTENTIRVGTGITLDATNNIVSIGTAITLNSTTGVIEVDGSTIGSPSGDANYTGIVTASAFVGDGSGLTGIVAASSGVEVRDNNSLVGTASTLNFGQDLDVTLTGEVATINVSIPLSALTDVDTSNLSGISTDYIMVYDPSVPGFKFVDPKTYFGINNDANPDPTIDDFGTY